jgi:molecular chaperone HtpG
MTGTLSIHSENIFPIIKKFLYSDEEVFLRELVSNGVDALQKVRALHGKGETVGELGELKVEILLDEEAKTLTVRDTGLGMTADEVERYINQIAFSSATEFLDQYKDAGAQIIGHFGLGFYSAFMVAEKVELHTRSYRPDAEPVHWWCTGDTSFEMETGTRTERGTDVVLHINDASQDYLKPWRVREVLTKYGKFLPMPIYFEGTQINNPEPAWVKSPAELTDDDYKKFYAELYPMSPDPLFWIHLNVDYPFTLRGILYFPPSLGGSELQRQKIHLYQNQVFVTDNLENVVPEYLMLLHGVIDSPDIPLNVSRSYLQTDANVRKIAQHISKKVAQKLQDMEQDNRPDFEAKWPHISVFVKFGMMKDTSFAERAREFALVTNTHNKHFSLQEYRTLVGELQTDKNDRQVWLYTQDKEGMDTYVAAAERRHYDVLLLDDVLDVNWVQYLEPELKDVDLRRVDSDSLDRLIDKGIERPEALTDEQRKPLEDVFKNVVGNDMAAIKVEALSEQELPVQVVRGEFQRRMSDMANFGAFGAMGKMPDLFTVVVNTQHPLVARLQLLPDGSPERNDLARHLYDLALLAQGMLRGRNLTDFIERDLQTIRG